MKLPYRHLRRKAKVAPAANAKVAYVCDIWCMAQQRHYIKEWRKFRSLTQEQLAERIGIDKSYLSKIETGKRRYDQQFLEAAADALRCEPGDLIVRNPLDVDGVWSIWDQLEPTQRRQWIEIGKTIKRTGTGG